MPQVPRHGAHPHPRQNRLALEPKQPLNSTLRMMSAQVDVRHAVLVQEAFHGTHADTKKPCHLGEGQDRNIGWRVYRPLLCIPVYVSTDFIGLGARLESSTY
jgi:hypothetical protein